MPSTFMVDKISINKDRPCLENTSTVSIIIVSYNTRDLTLECIQSVIDETTLPYELIVLDNNSSDGSADAIASRFPDVQLIRSTENHGFAGGNNRAASCTQPQTSSCCSTRILLFWITLSIGLSRFRVNTLTSRYGEDAPSLQTSH